MNSFAALDSDKRATQHEGYGHNSHQEHCPEVQKDNAKLKQMKELAVARAATINASSSTKNPAKNAKTEQPTDTDITMPDTEVNSGLEQPMQQQPIQATEEDTTMPDTEVNSARSNQFKSNQFNQPPFSQPNQQHQLTSDATTYTTKPEISTVRRNVYVGNVVQRNAQSRCNTEKTNADARNAN